jgi:hypothetical protein
LTDAILDVPGLDECLGKVLGACISASFIDITFVKKNVMRMVEDMGDFTPRPPMRSPPRDPTPPPVAQMFASMLKMIQDNDGDEGLTELWLDFVSSIAADKTPITLEQVTAENVKKPWWGTNEELLGKIPDRVLASWLKNHGFLASIAPGLESALEEK